MDSPLVPSISADLDGGNTVPNTESKEQDLKKMK